MNRRFDHKSKAKREIYFFSMFIYEIASTP